MMEAIRGHRWRGMPDDGGNQACLSACRQCKADSQRPVHLCREGLHSLDLAETQALAPAIGT